jgi:transitional endoplasmic reticulum ATPase
LPDKKTRLEILKVHVKGMPLAKNVSLEALAEKTEHFNGADIQGLCREAALHALRLDVNAKEVTMKDFEKILEKIAPSVKESEIKRYKEIEEAYIRTARAAQVQSKPSYLG